MESRAFEEIVREQLASAKFAEEYLNALIEDGLPHQLVEAFTMIADIHGLGKKSPLNEATIRRIVEVLGSSKEQLQIKSAPKPTRKSSAKVVPSARKSMGQVAA